MTDCELLRDWARRFNIGRIQSDITKKQINAINKSPIFVFIDLIFITNNSLPYTAFAESFRQIVCRYKEYYAYHRLENADCRC